MIIHRIPAFIPRLFPKLIWSKPSNPSNIKTIYLTFDDGPTEGVTEFVLNELNKFQAKASFFVIGDKINQFKSTFQKIIDNGHSIGNHTFNHLNAWNFPDLTFEDNFYKCQHLLEENQVKSIGFRPPYGRINNYIYKDLSLLSPIVMWSILSGDYQSNLNPISASNKIMSSMKDGDIIVFHDSEKASKNLSVILPKILEFGHKNNFEFKAL